MKKNFKTYGRLLEYADKGKNEQEEVQKERKPRKKFFGRTSINRLDWLLAWTCVIGALGALWMSLGILIRDAAPFAVVPLKDFALSLAFSMNAAKLGTAVAPIVINTMIFYGSLVLVVCGTIALGKKDKKDRIPGLFASLVAAIFFGMFLLFVFEFMVGAGQGSVALVFPIVLILFMACMLCVMVLGTYAALGSCNIELKKNRKEPEYYDEVEEFVEEPEEEEKEEFIEPEKEPEEPEVEESEEESDEFSFDELGKRRKRIPFEKKIKRSTSDTRTRYQMIVSELRKYDFNDRTSIPGETFSYKREKLIFITFSGNTLKVHFRLDPKEFEDSPLPIKDASDVKRFEDVPAFIKIKSDLAARRAVALGERVAEENSVPKK